jgi:HEAT repeat protein
MEGLVELLSGSPANGEMASIAREDVRTAAPEGVHVLGELLLGPDLPPRQRWAAADLMGALALELPAARSAAVDVLATVMGRDTDSLVRDTCARILGRLDEDVALPHLLLRLKYEKDDTAALGLALALAHLGNGAGLGLLDQLERRADPRLTEALSQARATLPRLLAVSPPGDEAAAWDRGAIDLEAPSAGLRLAVWRTIAALHGDRFQLRGVDDARFVLARLGPWAADLLGEALSDEDLYVRVHAAQCLGRMGERAASARASLLTALNDPLLAPDAAEALGSIPGPGVGDALRARLGSGTDQELRASAVRALGRLGESSSIDPLRSLFESDIAPPLRVVCAESLVHLGAGDALVPYLAGQLKTERGPQAEVALDLWISTSADPELAAAWGAYAAEPGQIPTPAEATARRRLRARLLAPFASAE